MSDLYYECPQCRGRGCGWCDHTGQVTMDRYREVKTENRKMDDDRDWAAERDRRSGAYFER